MVIFNKHKDIGILYLIFALFSGLKNKVTLTLQKRIIQESFLLGSAATLIFKILFYCITGTQCLWYASIAIFFIAATFNRLTDFYAEKIREWIYHTLIYLIDIQYTFPLDFNDIPEIYKKRAHKAPFSSLVWRSLVSLIYIRLCMLSEPILLAFIRCLIVYALLFNHLLLMVYLLSFIIILSRIVFYITDYNTNSIRGSYKQIFHALKNNYRANNDSIEQSVHTIRPSINNAQILSFWIFRCQGTDPIIDLDEEVFFEYYLEHSWKIYIELFEDFYFLNYSDFNDASLLKSRELNTGILIKSLDIQHSKNQILYEFCVNAFVFSLIYILYIYIGEASAEWYLLDTNAWFLRSSFSASFFRFVSFFQKNTLEPVINCSEKTASVESLIGQHPSYFVLLNNLLFQYTSGTINPYQIYSANQPVINSNHNTVVWRRGVVYQISPSKINLVKTALENASESSSEYPSGPNIDSLKENKIWASLFLMTNYQRKQLMNSLFSTEFDFKRESEGGMLLPDIYAGFCGIGAFSGLTTAERVENSKLLLNFHERMCKESKIWAENQAADSFYKIHQLYVDSYHQFPTVWDYIDLICNESEQLSADSIKERDLYISNQKMVLKDIISQEEPLSDTQIKTTSKVTYLEQSLENYYFDKQQPADSERNKIIRFNFAMEKARQFSENLNRKKLKDSTSDIPINRSKNKLVKNYADILDKAGLKHLISEEKVEKMLEKYLKDPSLSRDEQAHFHAGINTSFKRAESESPFLKEIRKAKSFHKASELNKPPWNKDSEDHY